MNNSIEYTRRYYRDNSVKLNDNWKNYRDRKKMSLYKAISHGLIGCRECGHDDIRTLQVDHIMDTGARDRRRFRSQTAMYVYYCNHPLEAFRCLQLLCANCNWIKRAEG